MEKGVGGQSEKLERREYMERERWLGEGSR